MLTTSPAGESVLVLTAEDDCEVLESRIHAYSSIALLFWSSPEYVRRLESKGCRVGYRLADLIGDRETTLRWLYAVAEDLSARMPEYRGVPVFSGLEPEVAIALFDSLIVARLHSAIALRSSSGSRVVFTARNKLARLFEAKNDAAAEPLEMSTMTSRRSWRSRHRLLARAGRLASRTWGSGDLGGALWQVLDWLDEGRSLRRVASRSVVPPLNRAWFYSTYVNFSRALLSWTPADESFPLWLVNGRSGRLALPRNATWHYLWQFGATADHSEERRRVLSAAREVCLAFGAESSDAGTLPFSTNTRIEALVSRDLMHQMIEIDLLLTFFEIAKPRQIWVANQWGGEGLLIAVARRLGVSVTQVQHGTLSEYYGCSPIYSDRFIVWGDFWAERLARARPGQVSVRHVGERRVPAAPDRGRVQRPRRLTFFTLPVYTLPFSNTRVAVQEAAWLLGKLTEAGHHVTIRVHPMDHADLWRRALSLECPETLRAVVFDTSRPLETCLSETDVAVIYFSSVFMDCAVRGIPVVSLGWYPLLWQGALEKEGWFHVAQSIEEAVTLVDTVEGRARSTAEVERIR